MLHYNTMLKCYPTMLFYNCMLLSHGMRLINNGTTNVLPTMATLKRYAKMRCNNNSMFKCTAKTLCYHDMLHNHKLWFYAIFSMNNIVLTSHPPETCRAPEETRVNIYMWARGGGRSNTASHVTHSLCCKAHEQDPSELVMWTVIGIIRY